MSITPYIALTDYPWFEYLAAHSDAGRVDEVNFWSPRSLRPLKAMRPGEPVFFRLKKPRHCIVGYGFFAHFAVLGLDEAWQLFGDKNGDPDEIHFLERIGKYRKTDLLDPSSSPEPLGCTILRHAMFWKSDRWIPWRQDQGWHTNTERGQTEHDPARTSLLLHQIEYDHVGVPEEFVPEFVLVEADERKLILARSCRREGQGTFRTRLLDVHARRCAITGERTEPVLDAAHVQPYLGPRSNHVQNGLILSKEFHALFDDGLVTITPDYRVRVSRRIRERWSNGRRYYEFDGRPLVQLPDEPELRPSLAALEWHNEKRFAS